MTAAFTYWKQYLQIVATAFALSGGNIYTVAGTLNGSNSGNCLHNCSEAVGRFRVGKFNCAMYQKLDFMFVPCGSYYTCAVILNNCHTQSADCCRIWYVHKASTARDNPSKKLNVMAKGTDFYDQLMLGCEEKNLARELRYFPTKVVQLS